MKKDEMKKVEMNKNNLLKIGKMVWQDAMQGLIQDRHVCDNVYEIDKRHKISHDIHVAPQKKEYSDKETKLDKTIKRLVNRKKNPPAAVASAAYMQCRSNEWWWYVLVYTREFPEYCVVRKVTLMDDGMKYGKYRTFEDGFGGFMDKIGSKIRIRMIPVGQNGYEVVMAK